MTMTKIESKTLTDDYLVYAEDEYKAGNISEEQLSRIKLSVAAEYLLHYDNEELCLITINTVPEAYFTKVLAQDMENDSLLAASLAELAYHLERRGITWHGTIKTTQAPAQA